MDTSANADAIPLNCSPNVCNMELRNGVWGKRYGFERLNSEPWGENVPVDGMYEFYKIDSSDPIFLVAWNGKIYSCDVDGNLVDLCTGSKSSLTKARTGFFTFGDKCYIYNGTDYCVYDGVNPIADVPGYVPTVSISRSPDGITTAANEEFNLLSNSWKDEFAGTADATEYILSSEADSIENVWINGVEQTDGFSLDSEDKSKMVFTTSPGASTVLIQATKAGLNDSALISGCTLFDIWGGKADTRVFALMNPNYPNVRWMSGLTDPTYFPINNDVMIGSDAEPITGVGHMADYQIVYKQRSEWYTGIETQEDGSVIYPTLPMNDEYGCIAPRTVCAAQGGLLALSADGVTFSIPSFVRGQMNVTLISQKINKAEWLHMGIQDFSKEDRENAFAYIFDQKYWLHIKDYVWILDLSFSILSTGVYCWYPFSGIPGKASQFLERNGLLYSSDRSQGLIYKQNIGTYLDDEDAVDAWWTSPLLFMGLRGWIKKFTRVKLTFKADQISDHILSFITDQGAEDIHIRQDAGIFSYSNFSYKYWTYGVLNAEYPSTQAEKCGYKGEYLQIKIRNNSNRGLTLMSASVDYLVKKEVK